MPTAPERRTTTLLRYLALLLLLLAAGYFRFTGLTWGDYQYQHPDERFLIWVVADIAPVETLGEYFDSANSTLNPVNRGHGFYVYGDFPVIATRYAAESVFEQVGWREILQVGRGLSALLDLLTVLLVYLIAERLMGWKTATLAGLLSGAAVLQIQQAHFFTSDAFAVFFTTLTIYLGVLIAGAPPEARPGRYDSRILRYSILYGAAVGMAMACKINTAPVALLLPAALGLWLVRQSGELRLPSGAEFVRLFAYAAAGGAAAFLVFRIAMPYAFSGPGFFGLIPEARWLKSMQDLRAQSMGDVDFPPALQWARRNNLFSLQNMVLWGLGPALGIAAWAGVLAFAWRILAYLRVARSKSAAAGGVGRYEEPALQGEAAAVDSPAQRVPGVRDPANLRDRGDFEPELLEAHAPGDPALVGPTDQDEADQYDPPEKKPAVSLPGNPGPVRAMAAAAAPILSGEQAGLLLVWLWTGAYFLWQSLAWNPTMRYQLPIYPTLAIFAAWGLAYFWNKARSLGRPRMRSIATGAAAVTGVLVLALTLAWAFAFTRIYTRTETRLAASQWIFENVPGPVNLAGEADGQPWKLLLPLHRQTMLRPDAPFLTQFVYAGNLDTGSGEALFNAAGPSAGSAVASVTLPSLFVQNESGGNVELRARVYPAGNPDALSAEGALLLPESGSSLDPQALALTPLSPLQAGTRYTLELALIADADSPVVVQMDGQITAAIYQRARSIPYQSDASGFIEIALPEGGTLRQIRAQNAALDPLAVLPVLLVDVETEQLMTANAVPPAGASGAGTLALDTPLALEPGKSYRVSILDAYTGQPTADQGLVMEFFDSVSTQWFPPVASAARPEDPLRLVFSSGEPAALTQVTLGRASQLESPVPSTVRVAISSVNDPEQVIASGSQTIPGAASAGGAVTLDLDRPLQLAPGESYNLTITPERGALAVSGAAPANESTWDMALPFRVGSYDPYGGYYRGDLTLEMYWDDNPDKYQRFVNILDQADYIFFSSNRQWGTTTRIPERYPLTTQFYRDLMGCPAAMDVITCYNLAEEGSFQGRLGFELVKVVTSYPNLGPFEINDQFAEEAFTVYDHPKVMIFRKLANYDPAVTRAILGAVDLDAVVHLTPRKAGDWHNLLLPAGKLAVQRAGGTFAELFPPGGLLNGRPWLGALVYYLFLFALGAVTYPALRMALPGLADRAYPLARTAGMVVFAYLAWLPGSHNIPVTRGLLAGVFIALALSGLLLAYLQRGSMRDWRLSIRYFAAVEVLALVLFGLGLLLRLGNPDLWHPIFGGEKPMDFSYFNAVLKSSVFPPYDPWFAGGYINYYYYGFVLVGMPIKLLGITPSVAYNLIMPGLFMMTGLGAFSVAYNLKADNDRDDHTGQVPARRKASRNAPLTAGLLAVAALLLIGNLGIPRMMWQGFQKLIVSDAQIAEGSLFERAGWAAQGRGKMVRGEVEYLPFYPSDWYWKPSRAIQPESGQEITEFPFFTFLYGDLHAHLIALPVTILAVGWALGIWLGRGRPNPRGDEMVARGLGLSASPFPTREGGPRGLGPSNPSLALAILFGALVAGALRPANTWDQYTFLALAAVALFAARFFAPGQGSLGDFRRWQRALLPVMALVGLALLLYYPFNVWFQQAYNTVEPWRGPKTNLASYLSHWGLFLFVIGGWLLEETLDWMAATPLSALARLRAHRSTLLAAAGAAAAGILALALYGVTVALIAAPLGIWVTLLILRPGQSNAKRAVLFAVGTALALTLAVELVAVRGDIGRMNSSFKFYYQAWTLFSLSAAAALAWLWPKLSGWSPGPRSAWIAALVVLVFSAALYPLYAVPPKFEDRMAPDTALTRQFLRGTLDGMKYMEFSRYTDGLTAESLREMDLSQDYHAIQWMQANVPGSPVIVEANTPEYRHWGTRYTIYTGLPGVVGWNWHQRQQRVLTPDTWIWGRIEEIDTFYRTTNPAEAAAFLDKYDVKYIILGQLERIWYPGPGLDKFWQLDGHLWDKVYENGETFIYEVRD